MFVRNIVLQGYLKCNGVVVFCIIYNILFVVIGMIFGVGDGVMIFNVFDLWGEFMCGWDDG